MTPSALVVGLLVAAPLLLGLGTSFTNWHLFSAAPLAFVGLDNWLALPNTQAFTTGINTLVFVAISVPVTLLIGVVVAMAVEHIGRGRAVFQTLFLLPFMISPVAVSIVAGMLLDPTLGPVNALLELVGVENPPIWSSQRWPATFAIVMVDVWVSSAFMILLVAAGLKSIPDDVYEAAAIDGASWWDSFRFVTLPLLVPVILVATILKTIVTFHIADVPLTLTGGGPGNTTEPLSLTVYNVGVRGGDMAMAATMSYFLLFLMAVVVGGIWLITRSLVKKVAP